MGKEKLLVMSNFSFFHSVFYLLGELPAIFIKFEIVDCILFQFGRVQNLTFGKGLTSFSTLFQLHRVRKSTYPCYLGVSLTSILHNLLFICLLSHMTIVNGERAGNPVGTTILNPFPLNDTF